MVSVWHWLREHAREYDPVYHERAHKEFLSLNFRPPRVVLDLGCATGATSRLLKERYPKIAVIGVDPNASLEAKASEVCTEFYCQSVEQFLDALPAHWLGKVDTVILGDVLEHLVDPCACLERLHDLLTADAQILLLLSNIRNARIMDQLAQGYFSYQPSDILDVTHLRFFTKNEAEYLFQAAGYVVKEMTYVIDEGASQMLACLDYSEASTHFLTFREVDDGDFQELTSRQFCFLLNRQNYQADKKTLLSALVDRLRVPPPPPTPAEDDANWKQNHFYHTWALKRTLSPARRRKIQHAIEHWEAPTCFHFAAFVAEAQLEQLRETYFALASQLYPHWRMSVLSFEEPGEWWKTHANCSWHVLGEDDDSLEFTNHYLAEVPADWVGVLYPGDRLPPEALFILAESAGRHPEWAWIYSDEDQFTLQQTRVNPLFKPDFSPDLLRSLNYAGGLGIVRRPVFAGLGGFDGDFEGVEDYDLALRLSATLPPTQIGHVADVLYHRHEAGRVSHLDEDELWELGRQALERHCLGLGWAARVSKGPVKHTWSTRYEMASAPSVTILLTVKESGKNLQRCVAAILKTSQYDNYEIVIVDARSPNKREVDELALQASEKVRFCHCDTTLNESAMLNFAVASSAADYLLILDSDFEVKAPDWLEILLGFAEVTNAGVVGALLVATNGLVEHAGMVLGLGNTPAQEIFGGMQTRDSVLLERLRLTQNYSAVGAGCLLTKRADYLAVGGFNDNELEAAYHSVDFCLKVSAQLGKRVVWTPDVRLARFAKVDATKRPKKQLKQAAPDEPAPEKLSAKTEAATEFMYATWPEVIAADPYYNRNLTLINTAGGIESDPLLANVSWRAGPFVVAFPNDHTGCGEYRIKAPMRTLLDAGKIDGGVGARILGPSEVIRLNPDVIVVQRQLQDHQVQAIPRYRKRVSSFLVYELDDLVTVSWSEKTPDKTKDRIAKSLRTGLAEVDRFVASTARIAEEYGSWCKETVIVPNYLPLDRWAGVQARRLGRDKPRVGWAGGGTHAADLEMIADVVKILQHEVEWVFFGMCPEALRPYVHEFHEGVPIDGYPARLAGMNLDLALAPLRNTEFNQARTALRILEYGVLGYPVIASDMPSFRLGFPVTLVSDSVDDWVSAIREMISDRANLASAGDRLRQHILDHWIMDKNVDVWFKAWMP